MTPLVLAAEEDCVPPSRRPELRRGPGLDGTSISRSIALARPYPLSRSSESEHDTPDGTSCGIRLVEFRTSRGRSTRRSRNNTFVVSHRAFIAFPLMDDEFDGHVEVDFSSAKMPRHSVAMYWIISERQRGFSGKFPKVAWRLKPAKSADSLLRPGVIFRKLFLLEKSYVCQGRRHYKTLPMLFARASLRYAERT